MAVKITCINKSGGYHNNPHEAISNLGWINEESGEKGISTKKEIIEFLKEGNQAYTRDRFGNVAYLIVKVSALSNKYVQTIADGTETDNLLSLPECPIS